MSTITDRQHSTALSLTHQWAKEHRVFTLAVALRDFIAAHPDSYHLNKRDRTGNVSPEYSRWMEEVCDRIGGEYASRIIGRTVTSLHDLTVDEASVVIGALMQWARKNRRFRR
jgi:hypothetical protein